MTDREQARLQVLNRLVAHQMATHEAAAILGLSKRHTWRMLAAYREEGAAALAHGNRGRRPPNAVAEGTRQQVLTLARTRYAGLNHTHLTEILAERESVVLTRSTVRSILLSAGLASPRYRRPQRHRHRRQRMPQEGMLLQLDGSYHACLEDRGPWLTLLLAVDDATGTVPYAVFREREDTHGYFMLLQGIIARHGIPLGVYTDRHAVFQSPDQRLKEVSTTRAIVPTQWAGPFKSLELRKCSPTALRLMGEWSWPTARSRALYDALGAAALLCESRGSAASMPARGPKEPDASGASRTDCPRSATHRTRSIESCLIRRPI